MLCGSPGRGLQGGSVSSGPGLHGAGASAERAVRMLLQEGAAGWGLSGAADDYNYDYS